ncbi:hypothetical protein C8D88_108180 [Lentzea atacamensis]|uniref:Uncharacterized protein n=1 Tax=Lentzea atacamensis TaxID=531938 RepID=A0A316I2E4_9PSEU|nr:hypothetical protein [Lentzea atacamensis]PWK84565.1 hypothetical protein C8D88_108180 [Lentzea atacamensis]
MSDGFDQFPDVRVMFATTRLADLARKADLLDGPAQTQVVRVLSTRSKVVRGWATAERRAAVLLSLGLSLNVVAFLYAATGAYSPWSVVALVAGTSALSAAVLFLWRGNQDALALAIGTYVDVTPRPEHNGDAAE